MITFSDHVEEEMLKSDIKKNEVINCLEHGELIIKQFVNNEVRYGKQIEFKDKTIIVIYTYKNKNIRIITTYSIRRKKW